MALTLNNENGFVIDFKTMGINDKGNCIRLNCERIAEFWNRGWTDTILFISQIKRITDGKLIKHVNIYNEKTGKIIDVSNGFIKMIDMGQWTDYNEIVKIAHVSRRMIGEIDVELLVAICNYIFNSYTDGNDLWKRFQCVIE